MPVFQYQALDAKGNESKGQIEALSSKEAISKIRNKGLFPTKVRAQNAFESLIFLAMASNSAWASRVLDGKPRR